MSLADAGWTLSGSDAIRTLSVANGDLPATGLAPGSSVDVTIVLMLSASADLSCDLTNWSEITFSTDTDGDVIADNDSTPDADQTNDVFGGSGITDDTGGDEDDHDNAVISILQIFDLALQKELEDYFDLDGTGDISQNDDVLFTISLYNQGNVAATNVEITDYIPAGMSLSVNDSNGWTLAGAGTATNVISSCLLYTSPSPRDATLSRMPSSA